MDDSGNILVKRIAKSNVYVKLTTSAPNGAVSAEDTAVGTEIVKLGAGPLEPEKPMKLFDMRKFQHNVNRELRRGYPDRYGEAF